MKRNVYLSETAHAVIYILLGIVIYLLIAVVGLGNEAKFNETDVYGPFAVSFFFALLLPMAIAHFISKRFKKQTRNGLAILFSICSCVITFIIIEGLSKNL